MEDLCKYFQLNIGDKPLSGFNALNRIFIEIYTFQLHAICQTALGKLWFGGFARDAMLLPAMLLRPEIVLFLNINKPPFF